MDLEKKKLHSSNNDIKNFCYTIEVNGRRIDELEDLVRKSEEQKVEKAEF